MLSPAGQKARICRVSPLLSVGRGRPATMSQLPRDLMNDWLLPHDALLDSEFVGFDFRQTWETLVYLVCRRRKVACPGGDGSYWNSPTRFPQISRGYGLGIWPQKGREDLSSSQGAGSGFLRVGHRALSYFLSLSCSWTIFLAISFLVKDSSEPCALPKFGMWVVPPA